MSLTHWSAPKGTVKGMSLSAGWRQCPGGRRPLMIKQDAVECVQPAAHYYPACALNVSRRRKDDSIDLMKVLFIFSQILSPVITEALQHCHQPVPHSTGGQIWVFVPFKFGCVHTEFTARLTLVIQKSLLQWCCSRNHSRRRQTMQAKALIYWLVQDKLPLFLLKAKKPQKLRCNKFWINFFSCK